MDADSLCAFARFCDPNGQVWSLVGETDDAAAKRDFVRQTCDCPSGRLVAADNATGEPIEPHFEPSLALIEDPVEGCSSPLWVRGGVCVVSADGFHYEIRNRIALCRCGASKNKPFCDGSHAAIKFRDGLRPDRGGKGPFFGAKRGIWATAHVNSSPAANLPENRPTPPFSSDLISRVAYGGKRKRRGKPSRGAWLSPFSLAWLLSVTASKVSAVISAQAGIQGR